MAPFMELMNHKPLTKITWLTTAKNAVYTCAGVCPATEGEIVFESGEDVRAGQEVYNNYGAKGNEEFLLG